MSKLNGAAFRSRVIRRVSFGVLVISVAVLAGCIQQAHQPQSLSSRTVTDDLGRRVDLPQRVTRAISLAPSITEMIFAVGAGDRLVGVTSYCNYPEDAKAIQKIGDTMTPNMETIVALKPDVVLVSTASQLESFTRVLEENRISVFVTNPKDLDGVFGNLRLLGELFGTQRLADDTVGRLRQRLKEIESFPRYGTERVFVQISKEPLFTIGKESFLTKLIELADGVSVTADVETAYPKLSPEAAAALDPDVIILSDSSDNGEPNDALKNSKAVKAKRIYKIDADIISRPGPRLVDALEQITRMVQKHRS